MSRFVFIESIDTAHETRVPQPTTYRLQKALIWYYLLAKEDKNETGKHTEDKLIYFQQATASFFALGILVCEEVAPVPAPSDMAQAVCACVCVCTHAQPSGHGISPICRDFVIRCILAFHRRSAFWYVVLCVLCGGSRIQQYCMLPAKPL